MNDARLDSDTIDFAIIFPPKVNLTKATDYCSNCGAACAPTASIEVDPLCTGCKFDFKVDSIFPPSPNDTFPSALPSNNDPIELSNYFADPRMMTPTCLCGKAITAQGANRCFFHLYT